MDFFMKVVKSWKPLNIFEKRSIVDCRLSSEYISAIRIIQSKTKFEHAKEHFMSDGLLNICKLYDISWNTTMHLKIPVKQPFPLLLGIFKGFLMYIQQVLCDNMLSKKSS